MRSSTILLISLLTIASSCGNQNQPKQVNTEANPISEQSNSLISEIDSSTSKVLVAQERLLHELDSLQSVLNDTKKIATLSKDEYVKLTKAVARNLKDLELISRLGQLQEEVKSKVGELQANKSNDKKEHDNRVSQVKILINNFKDSVSTVLLKIANK